jgi:hypothetical protein
MEDSLPSPCWLWLSLVMASVAVVLFLGAGEGNVYFYTFVQGAAHSEEFELDPVMNEFFPKKLPIFFKLVSDIYEIPFYHLFFGIIGKCLLVMVFFFLSWKITRSSLASLISVLMIFGLLKFDIGTQTLLSLKPPFVPDSMEFRQFTYLSFRQISALFCISGTLFFIGRKFVASSIFLALAVYVHPHNGMNFFVGLSLSLLLCVFLREKKLSILKDWLKFNILFLAIIAPYLIKAMSAFKGVEPLAFPIFWELALKNEASDASLLFWIKHVVQPNNPYPPYILSLYLTLAACVMHFIFRSNIPKLNLDIKKIIRDKEDMVWPTLLAPWLVIGFGWLWESGLMTFLPDTLNTQIAILHIRRINMISHVLYTPIFSMFLARILLLLFEKTREEFFESRSLEKVRTRLGKIKITSRDQVCSIGLSMLALVYVLVVKNENVKTLKDFLVFEKKGFNYSTTEEALLKSHDVIYLDSEKAQKTIQFASFLDTCRWIKENTSPRAAFFNPSYIGIFRTCSKRQAFIEEAMGGNFAITDRRYAAIYYQRFSDIHAGLLYNDLPMRFNGEFVNPKGLYPLMRAKYLSLDEKYIASLSIKYPGYRYFLTETNHRLSFPLIYQNEHFLLYDLEGKSSLDIVP